MTYAANHRNSSEPLYNLRLSQRSLIQPWETTFWFDDFSSLPLFGLPQAQEPASPVSLNLGPHDVGPQDTHRQDAAPQDRVQPLYRSAKGGEILLADGNKLPYEHPK